MQLDEHEIFLKHGKGREGWVCQWVVECMDK